MSIPEGDYSSFYQYLNTTKSNLDLLDRVRLGIEQGKKLSEITIIGETGKHPLHIACARGIPRAIKAFIEMDPKSIDAVDSDGNTPIHTATLFYRSDSVKILKLMKCLTVKRVNETKNNDGMTACTIAEAKLDHALQQEPDEKEESLDKATVTHWIKTASSILTVFETVIGEDLSEDESEGEDSEDILQMIDGGFREDLAAQKAMASKLESWLDEATGEVDALTEKKGRAHSDLESSRRRLEELTEQIQAQKEAIEEKEASKEILEKKYTPLQRELEALRSQHKEAEEEKEKAEAALSKLQAQTGTIKRELTRGQQGRTAPASTTDEDISAQEQRNGELSEKLEKIRGKTEILQNEIDAKKRAVEQAEEVIESLAADVAKSERKKKELEEQTKGLPKQISILEKEKQTLSSDSEKLTKEVAALSKQVATLHSQERELMPKKEEAEKALEKITSALTKLKKTREGVKQERDQLEGKLTALKEQRDRIKNSVTTYTNTLTELETKSHEVTEQLSAKRAQLAADEEAIRTLDKEKTRGEETLTSLAESMKNIEADIEQAQSKEAGLETKLQVALGKQTEEEKKLRYALTNATKKVATLGAQLGTQKGEKKKLEKDSLELAPKIVTIRHSIEIARKELKALENENKDLTQKRDAIKPELKKLRLEVEELERDSARLEKERNGLRADIAQYKAKIEELKAKKTKGEQIFKKLGARVEEITLEIEEKKKQFETLQTQESSFHGQIRESEATLDQLKAHHKAVITEGELLGDHPFNSIALETFYSRDRDPMKEYILSFGDPNIIETEAYHKSIESTFFKKRSLLQITMHFQMWDIALLLVQYGADPEHRDDDNKTALNYLNVTSKDKTEKELRKCLLNPIQCLEIPKAIEKGETVRAIRLLSHYRGDIDAIHPDDHKNLTFLHKAALKGNTGIARALIQMGADIDKVGGESKSPFSIASDQKIIFPGFWTLMKEAKRKKSSTPTSGNHISILERFKMGKETRVSERLSSPGARRGL